MHHLSNNQNPSPNKEPSQNQVSSLIAFFARTPPPQRPRRPYQFQRRNDFNSNRANGYNHRFRTGRRPYVPRCSTKNSQCYSCRRFGHIMRNCPQKRNLVDRLANFVHLGEASKMIVNSLESESDSNDMD